MKLLSEWRWGGGSRAGVRDRVKQQLAFSFAAMSADHVSLYVENHFPILPWVGRGGKRRAFFPCHSERTLKTYLLRCFLQGVCCRVLISTTIYWLLEEKKKSWSSVVPSSLQLSFTSSYIALFPLSIRNVKTHMSICTYTARSLKISKSCEYSCLKNQENVGWPWSCLERPGRNLFNSLSWDSHLFRSKFSLICSFL